MRGMRWALAAGVAVAALTLCPTASADGGAYLELDRTYYPAGVTAHVETYVGVPAARRGVFDRGPFFAYLLPADTWLVEGRRLPRGAIRVGTFAIEEWDRSTFELSASFTVPDLETGFYHLQLCNDPCTVSGFREPLTGFVTVAGTAIEADLLADRDRLRWRVAGLRHRIGRLLRSTEVLESRLRDALIDGAAASADVARLQPAAAVVVSSPPIDADRPLVDPWALVAIAGAAIVALGAVALGVVFSRRGIASIAEPDVA